MGWLYLEVLMAFVLLIGIVWWTLPSKREEAMRHGLQKEDEQQSERPKE